MMKYEKVKSEKMLIEKIELLFRKDLTSSEGHISVK